MSFTTLGEVTTVEVVGQTATYLAAIKTAAESIGTYTDNIEPLLTSIRDNADAVETFLSSIGGYTDGVEALLTTIRDNADGVEALLTQLTAAQTIRYDDVSSTVSYIGYAAVGTLDASALWKIAKQVTSGTVTSITYADGNANFDNVWSNRAVLTYT